MMTPPWWVTGNCTSISLPWKLFFFYQHSSFTRGTQPALWQGPGVQAWVDSRRCSAKTLCWLWEGRGQEKEDAQVLPCSRSQDHALHGHLVRHLLLDGRDVWIQYDWVLFECHIRDYFYHHLFFYTYHSQLLVWVSKGSKTLNCWLEFSTMDFDLYILVFTFCVP